MGSDWAELPEPVRAVESAYGFVAPGQDEETLLALALTCDHSGAEICTEIAGRFTMAVACEDSGFAQVNAAACGHFRQKYPEPTLRHALFDQHHGDGTVTPFSVVTENAPFHLQHLVKSHQVFHNLGAAIAADYPGVLRDRELSGLYLGSGAHLSPILTAMRLIDDGAIDRARFTYTELNPDTAANVLDALEAIAVYQPDLYDAAILAGDTVTIHYRGAEITVTASVRDAEDVELNRYGVGSTSVYNYFYESEFRDADLIILHDIYAPDGIATGDLMTYQRMLAEEEDTRQRLVVAPDTFTPDAIPYPHTLIPGAYDCGTWDAEIAEPTYAAAVLADLTQPWELPAFHASGLSDAYYPEDQQAYLGRLEELLHAARLKSEAERDFAQALYGDGALSLYQPARSPAIRLALHVNKVFRRFTYYLGGEPNPDAMAELETLLQDHPVLVDDLNALLLEGGYLREDQKFWDALSM